MGVDGFYYNEVRGDLSDSRLSLFSYADLSDATTVNVNLLGHLEGARILYLVEEGGLAFSVARAQAHEDVLGVFTFDAIGVGNAETLDIAQAGDGNAKLLAMSVILQGTRSVAELTELLSNIQTDIRTDGQLDSETSGSALMNGARTINPALIRANLEQRYESLGVDATIPDFEAYLQQFIDSAPYDFTGGIQYPAGGSRPNLLEQGVTHYQSGTGGGQDLGFLADLPPATSLTIRLTRTSGQGPENAWSYGAVNGLNWNVSGWDGDQRPCRNASAALSPRLVSQKKTTPAVSSAAWVASIVPRRFSKCVSNNQTSSRVNSSYSCWIWDWGRSPASPPPSSATTRRAKRASSTDRLGLSSRTCATAASSSRIVTARCSALSRAPCAPGESLLRT